MAQSTPPAFAWAYNEALDPYPYDPAKAKALIAEAGARVQECPFFEDV